MTRKSIFEEIEAESIIIALRGIRKIRGDLPDTTYRIFRQSIQDRIVQAIRRYRENRVFSYNPGGYRKQVYNPHTEKFSWAENFNLEIPPLRELRELELQRRGFSGTFMLNLRREEDPTPYPNDFFQKGYDFHNDQKREEDTKLLERIAKNLGIYFNTKGQWAASYTVGLGFEGSKCVNFGRITVSFLDEPFEGLIECRGISLAIKNVNEYCDKLEELLL